MIEIHHLLFWGMFGLCSEIIFTALANLFSNKAYNLMGRTSVWMFPIYSIGLTYGFSLVQNIISNDFIRYLSYPLWIWLIEILVGFPASKFGIRIWDYRYLPDNRHWKGIISFIHFPIWVFFGFLVEFVDKLLK
tara:strand:+ start:236 stop:637 length:402 start_codon:yes stop_codon:yes gene_type:complete